MTDEAQGHRMDEIVAYVDGELAPAARRDFEVHLATCPECQQSLRAAEAALGAFDELLASKAPPLDMDLALAQLRRGGELARARRRRRTVWVGVSVGLAAAVFGIVFGLILGRQVSKPLVPTPAASEPRRTEAAPIAP